VFKVLQEKLQRYFQVSQPCYVFNPIPAGVVKNQATLWEEGAILPPFTL